MSTVPRVGESFTIERTFSKDDVAQFVELSGDANDHHVIEDDRGRLTVHGLLTATLPTIVGGRMNLIARTMDVEFIAPVYSDDQILCIVSVAEVEVRSYEAKVRINAVATNQSDVTVLKASIFGIVRNAG